MLHTFVSNFHLPSRGAPAARLTLADRVRRVVTTLLAQRQRRRELRQLLEMDDRALADIGLSRVDALRFAHGPDRRVARKIATPAPLTITAKVFEHYTRRAHALRAQAVRDLARRFAARVRHQAINAVRVLRAVS